MSVSFSAIVECVTSGQTSVASQAAQMVAFVAELGDPVALAECKAQAAAVAAYLARQKIHTVEEHNALLKVLAKVEHRLGEVLAETVKHGGHNFKQPDTMSGCLKGNLPKNITYKQSSRAQQLAVIAWDAIEAKIDAAKTKLSLARIVGDLTPEKDPTGDSGFIRDFSPLIQAGNRFGCIYVDPPWQYGNQATRASTDRHYGTMTVDEICSLPVGELAADRSHLHLWTTNGFLFECPRIMEAWGFTYKSCFVWVKRKIGIGNYWRVAHEFLLLGVRGAVPFAKKNLRSWEMLDRAKHSAKPPQVRGFIERASPGPYLELFGRRRVKGWTVWGNQEQGEEFRQQEAFAS